MSDIILRSELFESDRWLDLPSDTHRLCYIRLLPECDGVGNIKGGERRIWRYLRDACHVKTPTDSRKIMSDLQDADLVRRYEDDDCEYWHIPRFGSTRKYVTKKWPWSPWNDQNVRLTKDKSTTKQEVAENPTPNPPPIDPQLSQGVGVGVGVGIGIGKGKTSTRAKRRSIPDDFNVSDQVKTWAQEHGHSRLDERLTHFVGYAKANGKLYLDWDQAFQNAIRDNWAKLEGGKATNELGQWWLSESGTEAAGKSVEVFARAGESANDYKGRIRSAMQRHPA